MPNKKLDAMTLPDKLDKRKKLKDDDIPLIREMYATGQWSWQTLADHFGVSKRRIGQIVNPRIGEECREASRKYSRENHKRYYDTDKQREYVADIRKRKRAHAKAVGIEIPGRTSSKAVDD